MRICGKIPMNCEVNIMRSIFANLTLIFWAVIFGEILGYIASQLTELSYNFTLIGVVSAVVMLVAVNCLNYISKASAK
jgi:hypothetical protein